MVPFVPHLLGGRSHFPHSTDEKAEALRAEMTLPMSQEMGEGLKAVTLAPRNAGLLLRGPHRNHSPQKIKCALNVGKRQDSKAYPVMAITVSHSPAPGNSAGRLSLRTHRSKRGADTFPCHLSTKQT